MKNFQRLVITLILVSLMVCCFSVTTHAEVFAYAGFSALYSLLAKDFAILVADEVGPVVAEVWNALTKPMQDTLIEWERVKTGIPSEDFINAYVFVMIKVMQNNPLIVHRFNKTDITAQDVVAPGTKIEIKDIPLTSEQLDKIATETTRTKNLIRSMLDEFLVMKYDLEQYISHLPTSLTALRTQVIDGFAELKTILSTFRTQFIEKIDNIQTILSAFRATFNNKIVQLQEALTTKLADVQHVMSTFRTQFMEKIADVNTHLHAIRKSYIKISQYRWIS